MLVLTTLEKNKSKKTKKVKVLINHKNIGVGGSVIRVYKN